MPTHTAELLVVDDDSAMRRVLRTSLAATGFDVQEASSGEAALDCLDRKPFTLVLMDINMPGFGGIEACRRMRLRMPALGIVMISVRDGERDKIAALEAGADDYVTKPLRFDELLARIQSVLRRTRRTEANCHAILRAGDLELDLHTQVLLRGGEEVHLSQKEYAILEFLMRHHDTPVSHVRLLRAVWGPEYGSETEYLRTYIKNLRKKIERDPARPQYILTQPWMGYRFRNPCNAPEP